MHRLALPPLHSALHISNSQLGRAASRRGRSRIHIKVIQRALVEQRDRRTKRRAAPRKKTMPKSTSNRMGHGLEVGFCDSNGQGFSTKQPADHIERWSLPRDNGTHLVIPWRPHSKACGRNVTSYDVDVTTSASFLNFFVNAFGSFPQDMCDPRGSKAREATSASAPTCSAYEKGCEKNERLATFIVPRALRKLTLLDVEVTVRAYGSLAPLGKPQEKGERVVHWCHKYRKAREFEKLRPWRNRALPQDSESLIQRAYLEHHRRMTRLEPGFLVLSVLVYCFVRKRHRKSMVVDLVKLSLGVAAPCLFVLLARSAPIEDLALGAPEPPLLVLALIGQALIAHNRWPSLVGAVRRPRLNAPSRRRRGGGVEVAGYAIAATARRLDGVEGQTIATTPKDAPPRRSRRATAPCNAKRRPRTASRTPPRSAASPSRSW